MAKSAHKRLLNSRSQAEQLIIYTDGSGINGKVGAAAVGPSFTWNSFLGPAESFTMYSAELYGIFLATKMTTSRPKNPHHLRGRSAVRAIGAPGNKSG